MTDILVIFFVIFSVTTLVLGKNFETQTLATARQISAATWLVLPVMLLVCIAALLSSYPTSPTTLSSSACWHAQSHTQPTTALSVLITCFVTLTLFFALTLTRHSSLSIQILFNLLALVVITLCFLHTQSLILLLVLFESLLLVSLNILRLTSKSERIGEAISEMFMWTLFGSFFLLLAFFLTITEFGTAVAFDFFFLSSQSCSSASGLTCLCFLIGFGVKIPIWPFLSWLLKAHVEASVEFSILLSGFIVKLGVIGLWRVLDAISPDWFYLVVLGICLLGILDATLRLFAQNDLKKIVALTTVIEMNWLNICFILGDSSLIFLANFLLVAHCFTTTSEFLLVEYISKRYGTRDFWQVTGLWHKAPLLWYVSFATVLTTLGFPGTSIFFAKFLFLTTLLSHSITLFTVFLLVFFLVLPLYFMRLWVPVWFGLSAGGICNDLTSRELWIILVPLLSGLLLGLYPTFFFGIL